MICVLAAAGMLWIWKLLWEVFLEIQVGVCYTEQQIA